AGFYNGQMHKADVYNWVHERLLPAVLEDAGVESPTGFPIDTPEMKEDILTLAETTAPPEWLEETFEGASKQIVPYLWVTRTASPSPLTYKAGSIRWPRASRTS
ncbi:MAG TPA: hypothetical protein VN415_01860, partial [Dehalococcoidia bacterium]|nr:hypothetical protein [Dehalococcoidia bacterium]